MSGTETLLHLYVDIVLVEKRVAEYERVAVGSDLEGYVHMGFASECKCKFELSQEGYFVSRYISSFCSGWNEKFLVVG